MAMDVLLRDMPLLHLNPPSVSGANFVVSYRAELFIWTRIYLIAGANPSSWDTCPGFRIGHTYRQSARDKAPVLSADQIPESCHAENFRPDRPPHPRCIHARRYCTCAQLPNTGLHEKSHKKIRTWPEVERCKRDSRPAAQQP